MDIFVAQGYGLEIGVDVNFNIDKVVKLLNKTIFKDDEISSKDYNSLIEIGVKNDLESIDYLLDTILENEKGKDLIYYVNVNSDKEWIGIIPIYPWNKNNFQGMNQEEITDLFLETILPLVEEDKKTLKEKMYFFTDYGIS